ncbi:DUF6162 family protein [Ferrimonas balearica]|uniref:DUF6162 family protein n=1 Tax=Ferrimonas balearica TaxID=44012 RepID=UPI001C994780|nr:hypothetical protein [Ferrimonas balearica]MBY5991482.1 hypothetical protein [Ferrimonas balearica]
MRRGHTQIVVPDNGVAEGRYVGLAIGGILALSALLLPFHQAHHKGPALASHQVALDSLDSQVQVAVTDLRLTHEEIRDWHQDNLDEGRVDAEAWPPPAELAEAFLPPFDGGQWHSPAPGRYLGPIAGHTLVIDSRAAPAEIWLCDAPPAGLADTDLITAPCHQVVTPGPQTHKDH